MDGGLVGWRGSDRDWTPDLAPCVREVAAGIEWEPLGATEDGDGSIRT
jgi:hypothetical protein